MASILRQLSAICIAGLALGVTASAAGSSTNDDFAKVTVSDLASRPELWDGRKVEVVGIAVRQFENYGLYPNFASACGHRRSLAIYADWEDRVMPYRTNRAGTFRGIFRNNAGVLKPDGTILLANAAPGPGPLSEIQVVAWRGKARSCSSSAR